MTLTRDLGSTTAVLDPLGADTVMPPMSAVDKLSGVRR